MDMPEISKFSIEMMICSKFFNLCALKNSNTLIRQIIQSLTFEIRHIQFPSFQTYISPYIYASKIIIRVNLIKPNASKIEHYGTTKFLNLIKLALSKPRD